MNTQELHWIQLKHIQEYNDIMEDGFTTNKNTRGYFITREGLKRIKSAAKYAGLCWQAIAARPKTARELVERIEKEAQQ